MSVELTPGLILILGALPVPLLWGRVRSVYLQDPDGYWLEIREDY